MSTIAYSRTVPVRHDVDVLVVGGGPAGCAAAWAAAKQGARVLLAEGHTCLGGLGTAAMVPLFLGFTDGEHFLVGEFGKRVLDAMHTIGKNVYRGTGSNAIHFESLKRAYEDVLTEAGVQFVYQTHMVDLDAENGHVNACVFAAKSGVFAVKAQVYIDCTGDGDLAAWAGNPFAKGDAKGQMMGGTLCGVWTNIDWAKRQPGGDNRAIEQAYHDGVLDVLDKHLPGMFRLDDVQGLANIGHTFHLDGTDERSLTQALVRGRSHNVQYEQYYKKYLTGFENMELVASGSMLGVRETRIIEGDYQLVLQDFFDRAVFEDEIGRFSYPVDIHSGDDSSEGYDFYLQTFTDYRYKDGETYGIPFRVVLPSKLDNVFVAGRCVSTDRYMQSSIRVMPGCMLTGQAAGVAAAQCAAGQVKPHDTDVRAVQRVLHGWGVYLPNFKA